MSPKKDKHFAQGLQEALKSFSQLESRINENDTPEQFKNMLRHIITQLKLQAEVPQSSSFSSMIMSDLSRLNIMPGGFFAMKDGYEDRARDLAVLEEEGELWSSSNLYCHLSFLENHVARDNEAGARTWIDAFLFWAAAMLPRHKHFLLNMEYCVPEMTIAPGSAETLSGFLDCARVVSDRYLKSASLQELKVMGLFGFFVTEAKYNKLGENYITQAVCEMYTCAKNLQRKFIHGALSNGQAWIFLFLTLNDGFNGATYKQSDEIVVNLSWASEGRTSVCAPQPDIIAAVLAHWIENSLADLENDEWFYDPGASEQTGTR
ncbi:uncharacterized protein F5147DRAFT_769016 [Suillus discolor]|uniref:Uncharacterized protein n=1 Tax=Suillus discolor TaxID=1912936 RepID=A0A9P7FI28_9AGAM|nr:uncharacterized protein F5147DRAFT_769016 [Suillus discolor]KAG2116645.1 hypothetical protein F5147DRAFT_769016 [Suillus discolor]